MDDRTPATAAERETAWRAILFCVLFVAGMVVFRLACWDLGCESPDSFSRERDPEVELRESTIWAAQHFVRESLADPDSAVFPPASDPTYFILDQLGGTQRVTGLVTAPNLFGGTVRSRWVVHLRREGDQTMCLKVDLGL